MEELLKEMIEQQRKALELQSEMIELQKTYLSDSDKKFSELTSKLNRYEELLENIWANG